jgi:MFS family permease
VTDRGVSPHAQRDDPDSLLDSRSDPAGAAFGTMGSEASSDLNWFSMLRHRVQRRALGSSKYEWWVLWSLLSGLLALNFTFTVFNVDLHNLSNEFHTSYQTLSWTTVGPLLAYGLAAPFFGKVGDIFGHRRLYLFGLAGAMVSAILTALAPSVGMLIFARTLDGFQGAATGTASGALLNLVFRPEDRVKAMGWWSLVGAGGPVIGLSIGAPVIAAYGWRTLFWLQLCLLVVAFVVVVIVLPHRRGSPEEEAKRRVNARSDFKAMDWIGSTTMSVGVATLMLGLSLGASRGWTSVVCIVCWVVSAAMLILFVYRIRHAANPIIPAHYFHRRNFIMPMLLRTSANFAYFGGFFLFPIMMTQGYDKSTTTIGFLSIARPIAFAICSPIAGYMAVRIGERVSALAGTVCLTGSMLLFASLHPSSGVVMIVLALVLSGVGMGVAMPSSSSTMANAVLPSEFGVMSAAQLLAMQVGEVAGIEILLTVQSALVKHRGLNKNGHGAALLATYRIPFLIGAAFAALAVVCSSFIRSLRRDDSGRDRAQAVDHSL